MIILNKPYRVLCQFSDTDGRSTLKDFVDVAAVYPAGRLDFDSEGLVILTGDGQLQAHISQPRSKLEKRYWVQVDGAAGKDSVDKLLRGIDLKDGHARAQSAEIIAEPDGLWDRDPPIRYRKEVPTTWLSVAIAEGRNRQVRRMTAAAGMPALRLIRYRIGPWSLRDLRPGELSVIDDRLAWQQLRG